MIHRSSLLKPRIEEKFQKKTLERFLANDESPLTCCTVYSVASAIENLLTENIAHFVVEILK